MILYSDIREQCCLANRELPKLGLVDLTFGNVSVLDRAAGIFAIKPSGLAYDALTPADMILLDLEGRIVEGKLRPSSDTPTHRRLFQAFFGAGIGAIVHTHSRRAVAFAQAGRGLPCLGTTHADYFADEVPITRPMTRAEIDGEYEWETGNVIVERFQGLDPAAIPAVLVQGHGPFVWGPTAPKAVENALALEIVSGLAQETLQLNPQAAPLAEALREKHYRRKHGSSAYYGQ